MLSPPGLVSTPKPARNVAWAFCRSWVAVVPALGTGPLKLANTLA